MPNFLTISAIEYPFIYSETDGTGIEYDSLGSAWALTASIMFAFVTNDTNNLAQFEKSLTHYYEAFIARLECYGSPLDTDKAPDNEGVLAFIRAARLLHQLTKNQLYLDGRLASTWFALMPWASSSVLEGLLKR